MKLNPETNCLSVHELFQGFNVLKNKAARTFKTKLK